MPLQAAGQANHPNGEPLLLDALQTSLLQGQGLYVVVEAGQEHFAAEGLQHFQAKPGDLTQLSGQHPCNTLQGFGMGTADHRAAALGLQRLQQARKTILQDVRQPGQGSIIFNGQRAHAATPCSPWR